MSGRIVYTGNVIVDIGLAVEAIPEPGGDTIATASEITAGGGYNVMTAAVRDGATVTYAGQYGTGFFGTIVRDALAAGGFDTAQPGLPDLDSGYSVALVDASTERTFITHVGAEGRLAYEDLVRVQVDPDDLVIVSGYGLAHPVNGAALARWLPGLPEATTVVLDPSPLVAGLPAPVLDAALARTDVLSANAREARLMTPDAEKAYLGERAQALRGRLRPGGIVIVRDGGHGAWIADDHGVRLVPGFDVAAVDTTGAGDAHVGVFTAALTRGEDLDAAVRRANAAAALAVTRRGPATAPERAETDRLLREQNA
ncbi:PfkB family carbohydrate kinase [Glycomyces harbinensis]|uniref:Sugar or nucleoside kinase, ribokinase family n=1 Tax=Glycomyces harbinensis TaxID=58114 RepID=A0A1G6R6C0_9ACTN|nr:PfkB family carbohydrate kinase [Glycomyces harbinensis]SDD00210.1 Sugar or nucleoside kinase, ribokinase family [Glycomyces harbinensis]